MTARADDRRPRAGAPHDAAVTQERPVVETPAREHAAPRPTVLDRLGALPRAHWPLGVVLAGYALAAMIVPTLAPVPVSDDWAYARSVEILLAEGRVRILDLTVVTLIFQLAWGGLFALLVGEGFGALRLSSVVLVFLSAPALYCLCRELGVDRARSALGTAAYLFNPLAFVLGFSFMSDPQLTALLVIATYCYARGLRSEPIDGRAVLAGSVFAALAFLVRQQGALVPLAVVLSLLASRRLRPDRAGVLLFARIVALPATTAIVYYLWLRFIHGVPYWQTQFLQDIEDTGWGGAGILLPKLAFSIAIYLGFFALPVGLAALAGARRLARGIRWPGLLLLGGWAALLAAGIAIHGRQGRRMPYVPQFFNSTGLGPNDLLGGRPDFFSPAALGWLTAACAAASLALVLLLGRRVGTPGSRRPAAGLVAAILGWQALGIVPPSFHFRMWDGSLDRYFLPLLPFTICLALWALRDARLNLPLAWAVVGVCALFAVAGTRDYLVFQRATWDLARQANALGIPNTDLDAGASWDGYHLYEYSHANNIPQQTPEGRPWWVDLFASASNSHYVVAGAPLPDYAELARVEYSSWLQRQPVYLYLLRHPDVPGPP